MIGGLGRGYRQKGMVCATTQIEQRSETPCGGDWRTKVRAAQTVTHASLGRIEVSTLARSLDFPPVSFDFLHHVVVAALLPLGM